jgi:hypothetical protein
MAEAHELPDPNQPATEAPERFTTRRAELTIHGGSRQAAQSGISISKTIRSQTTPAGAEQLAPRDQTLRAIEASSPGSAPKERRYEKRCHPLLHAMHDGAASRAALSKRPSLKHEPRTEVQTSQAEQVRNSKSFRRAG